MGFENEDCAGSPDSASRKVCYVVSNDLVKCSSLLPSNHHRSFLVHSLAKAYGLFDPSTDRNRTKLQILRPTPANYKDLSVYHSRDYLSAVLNEENTEETFRASGLSRMDDSGYGLEHDCPLFTGLPAYVKLVAGATLTAAKSLQSGDVNVAICWDGGRHHARKSQASGFCYVADCILAILALKRTQVFFSPTPRKARIMYLDLDLHFSDAVCEAFVSSADHSGAPQVLTLSVHHTSPGFFPVSHLASLSDPASPAFDPFSLSLPLAAGASDASFAKIWPSVERVKDAFEPDFVVVQCGMDGLAGDPNAVWNWSLGSANGSVGWCLKRICNEWNCKTLLLGGGGGYNSANVARAWTYLTSIALDQFLSLDSDIPDHAAFPLYAPTFTLDVPPGTTPDRNTDEFLAEIDALFRRISEIIRNRMASVQC
ncbi:histone deacetylase complex protein [Laetiporus sulphureus 93-53]|uniref:histone deacetylase n=1 Tax=Laetiporus sulphureus 93-53 TaxID=1314785 RepID=A0A165GJE0_9APHY|nr:histone deacetylase complex protein [Laetiporus sulphureus 93-53]KZT10434.1 histone deacetylase complex protein [Laetiporus sulphureus 93-53]